MQAAEASAQQQLVGLQQRAHKAAQERGALGLAIPPAQQGGGSRGYLPVAALHVIWCKWPFPFHGSWL